MYFHLKCFVIFETNKTTIMANSILKGKRGIIFGALNNQSIAWKVAERAHEEGATFVLTNAPIAMRMGEINNLSEAPVLQIPSSQQEAITENGSSYISAKQE